MQYIVYQGVKINFYDHWHFLAAYNFACNLLEFTVLYVIYKRADIVDACNYYLPILVLTSNELWPFLEPTILYCPIYPWCMY